MLTLIPHLFPNITGGSVTFGGALYANSYNNDLVIANCTFERNQSPAGHGGAIYINSNNNNFFVEKSNFSLNSAFNRGGAIYSEFNNNNGQVLNSFFDDNEGIDKGGAVFVNGRNGISFKGCAFNRNIGGDSGGAVYTAISLLYSSSITYVDFTDCSFDHNTATVSDGGITCVNYLSQNEMFLHPYELSTSLTIFDRCSLL